jgi:hypothetical protein
MKVKALFLRKRNVDRLLLVGTAVCLAAIFLASCGGGSPLSNPSDIVNDPASMQGQKLSFTYFEKCVNDIFDAQLPITQNGVTSINSCAASGCHDTVNGTGGALRVVPRAAQVDLALASNTPDVIRTSDMYRNYYSAQGLTIVGAPTQSRLINKPQVNGTLHGGGVIFDSATNTNLKLMAYWISHPMPQGQDEFSTASSAMFDSQNGSCKTE